MNSKVVVPEAKQFFIVCGRELVSPATRFYATNSGGFFPFICPPHDLHKSPERTQLGFFHSKKEGEEFVAEYKQRPEDRQRVSTSTIVIEPAYPELQAYFEQLEANPRLRDNPLLPLVDKVMESFDFQRVQKAMQAVGGPAGVAARQLSIKALAEMAHELLMQLTEAEENQGVPQARHGGFHAWYDGKELHLSFEVESAVGKAEELGIPVRKGLRKQGRNWVERS